MVSEQLVAKAGSLTPLEVRLLARLISGPAAGHQRQTTTATTSFTPAVTTKVGSMPSLHHSTQPSEGRVALSSQDGDRSRPPPSSPSSLELDQRPAPLPSEQQQQQLQQLQTLNTKPLSEFPASSSLLAPLSSNCCSSPLEGSTWGRSAHRAVVGGLSRLPGVQLAALVSLTAHTLGRQGHAQVQTVQAHIQREQPGQVPSSPTSPLPSLPLPSSALSPASIPSWGGAGEAATLLQLSRPNYGGIPVAKRASLLGFLLAARHRPSEAWMEAW